MSELYEDMADTDLVGVARANHGAAGQGAIAELHRRHAVAMAASGEAVTRLTRWVLSLTLVLVVLTGVLVWLTVKL